MAASLILGWVIARPELSGDAAAQMHRAEVYYDSLVVLARAASSPRQLRTSTVVELGYLERLRLGLGSPFRLADFALSDSRLTDSTRQRLAWAILSRLRRGDAYVLDATASRALDAISSVGSTSGAAHLALIEHAIRAAADPRSGELTVRLAYALAAGERTINENGDLVATQVAALVRDRFLAESDLRELLRVSSANHLEALDELVRRRRARELSVERPAAEPLDATRQTEAMRAVPALLEQIRHLVDGHRDARRATVASVATNTLLGPLVAARLVELGAAQPPEAPVAVTLRSHRVLLLAPDLPFDLLRARERFATVPLNAEMLVGEVARLSPDTGNARPEPALTVLAAATALRAMAQEAPWFAGAPAPTSGDLRTEFGLAGVSFGAEVRADWQPYYLRLIESSLRDMQRVLGGLSVDGLRIHIGAGGLPDTVLAMHDPKTRTIRLSTVSSAGTLAHELAHDLDWQAARRLYAGSGYSTDRAMREQRGPLAASMRDLASARVAPRRGQGGDERPAEVFARSVDWLVAVSLAREGRSDGYLTAVQDAGITGYTTVSPVAMIFGAARPLVDAVQEMTYVAEPVREGFLDQWGDARSLDPYLLVRHAMTLYPRRRIGDAPRLFDDESRLSRTEVFICAGDGSSWAPELRVRQMLLDLALDSRALGLARVRARYFFPAGRPAWASSLLAAAPWAPAEGAKAVRRIRASLAAQLDADRAGDQLRFATPSIFRSSASSCSLSER